MPLVLFELGCSQSQFQPQSTSTPPGAQPAVSVTIDPESVVIRRGDSWIFTAIGPGVNWSIREGSAGGDVNNAGVYTAPATSGVYHVIATAQADPSRSATATVSVEKTGFTLTGSLKTPRLAHTATLLPNGLVYVAGGDSSDDYEEVDAIADQAELFNPATGAFQPGEKVMREFHTATLLQNGDVLFTGGISETESPTPTAELLKAGSTSLQPTGNMSVGRYSHTATLLLDGRVLITGGVAQSGTTKTAEIYDPVSGTFTPTGNMGRAGFHSATLLLTGKVLMTGYGSDAELFDPATNSFTPAGSFTTSGDTSYVYAATLLADGRVLVTNGPTAPSQIYAPTTGQFTPTGTMATWRANYTATLLSDGTVLIAGGYTTPSTPGASGVVPATSTEIYNPSTGAFDPGPTMRQGRYLHTSTRLPDGSVLFVGGTGGTTLTSAEIFH